MNATTRGERWAQAAILCLVAVLLGCLLHQTAYRDRADARFLPPVDEETFAAILAAHQATTSAPIVTTGRVDQLSADYRSSSPNGSPAGIGAGRS